MVCSTGLKTGVIVWLLSWTLGAVPVMASDKVLAVTEDFPPFQYIENEIITGLSTEIVRAMFEEAEVEADIRLFSWARAYKLALNQKDVVIFSIARTVKREPLFQWIGSIVDYQVFLFKRSDKDEINISHLSDAMKFKTGGVYDDVKQDYLVRQGFEVGKHIQMVKDEKTNLIKLYNKRIDLMPSEATAFNYLLKAQGYQPSDFEKAFYLEGVSSQLYVALSKGSVPETFEKLRAGLERLKEKPVFAEIKKKYLE